MAVLNNTWMSAGAVGSMDRTVQFYDANALEYSQRTVDVDLSSLYDRFLPLIPAGGRILDAGCGSGRDVRAFLERGFSAIGIDASQALVSQARLLTGVNCQTVRLENVEFDRCFDGVWACASLLHIQKQKVVDVLSRLRRALTDGGVMFASIRAGVGEVSDRDGRHFSYYTPLEFRLLLEQASFRVDEVWITDDLLPNRPEIRWINVIARRLA